MRTVIRRRLNTDAVGQTRLKGDDVLQGVIWTDEPDEESFTAEPQHATHSRLERRRVLGAALLVISLRVGDRTGLPGFRVLSKILYRFVDHVGLKSIVNVVHDEGLI